jgi:hypothetical protein
MKFSVLWMGAMAISISEWRGSSIRIKDWICAHA